jgi:hypothetical protein
MAGTIAEGEWEDVAHLERHLGYDLFEVGDVAVVHDGPFVLALPRGTRGTPEHRKQVLAVIGHTNKK